MEKNSKDVLRVLFLTTNLNMGGAERYLIDICREFKKESNVDFLIATINSGVECDISGLEGEIVHLNLHPYSITKRVDYSNYKKILDEFKPNIIHTHRFLAEFVSTFYIQKDVKYICHGHDNMIQFNKLRFQSIRSRDDFNQWMEMRRCVRKYKKTKTLFIANSKDTFDFFNEKLGNTVDHLQINLCFNYSKFYVEKKVNLNAKFIRILNVGSFQKKK
ncbi:MAG: glycosyltransferase, partial [Nitrososphaeraceae archaeon]|nr:glycosyltransferase [Nitrososphaeraceae archaeon]